MSMNLFDDLKQSTEFKGSSQEYEQPGQHNAADFAPQQDNNRVDPNEPPAPEAHQNPEVYQQSASAIIRVYDQAQQMLLNTIVEKKLKGKFTLNERKSIKEAKKSTEENEANSKLLARFNFWEEAAKELKREIPFTEEEMQIMEPVLAGFFAKKGYTLDDDSLVLINLALMQGQRLIKVINF